MSFWGDGGGTGRLATGRRRASAQHRPATPPDGGPAGAAVPSRLPGRAWDAVAATGYLAGAAYATVRLWRDPVHHGPPVSDADRYLAEWNLAWGAHLVTHPGDPFHTDLVNAPVGVNLAANTTTLGISVPLSPLTLAAGPRVAFAAGVLICVLLTAYAWYHVLSRHVVASRPAALLGGAFCGFAPGVLAHTPWHLNLSAQFLAPLIAWRVCALGRGGRWLRDGIILALLVAYQYLINQETLLLIAMATALFVGCYAAIRRDEARRRWRAFLAGLGVTAAGSAVLLAYPIWYEFLGPGAYRRLEDRVTQQALDVFSYASFGTNTLGWHVWLPAGPRAGVFVAEDNGAFGLPLLVICAVAAIWLWRVAAARAAAVTALALALCSFGRELVAGGRPTGIPGPWRLLGALPVFDSMIPFRIGMAVAAPLGLLLALAADRIGALARAQARWPGAPVAGPAGPAGPGRPVRWPGVPVRLWWGGLLAAALLPLLPVPVDTAHRPAVPVLFATGQWRRYIHPGDTVLALPVPDGARAQTLAWSAENGLAFGLVQGYFIGPGPAGRDGPSQFGAPPRPTDALLRSAYLDGRPPPVTDADRRQARVDVGYWRASTVAVRQQDAEPGLRPALEALFGPGTLAGGVWLWNVRGSAAG